MTFDSLDVESVPEPVTGWKNYAGWLLVGIISLCLAANVAYLFPVKVYETFMLVKNAYLSLKSKVYKRRIVNLDSVNPYSSQKSISNMTKKTNLLKVVSEWYCILINLNL